MVWHGPTFSLAISSQEPLPAAGHNPPTFSHLSALALCFSHNFLIKFLMIHQAQLTCHLSRLASPGSSLAIPYTYQSECELHYNFYVPPLVEFSLLSSLNYCNPVLPLFAFKCSCFLINVFKTISFPLHAALAVPHEFWHIMIPLTQRFGGLSLVWVVYCLLFPRKWKMFLLLPIFNCTT